MNLIQVSKELEQDRVISHNDDNSRGMRLYLFPLFLQTAIFFISFMTRIIPAPILPQIERDIGIGHAAAGSIFLFISLGYFIAMMGSGFVSSTFNHRRTILISAFSFGIAIIITSFSSNILSLCLGFLLVGLTAGLYLPSGIATITDIVDKKNWGKALAIHELAPNLSFVLAPIVAEILMRWFSWDVILVIMGFTSMLFGLFFWAMGKGGYFKGEKPRISVF